MASHVDGRRWRRRSSSARHWAAEVEAAVVGSGVGALAAEAATKKVAKVYAVEHDLLKDYTADGYTAAVEALIRKVNPDAGAVPAHLSGARFRSEARDAI